MVTIGSSFKLGVIRGEGHGVNTEQIEQIIKEYSTIRYGNQRSDLRWHRVLERCTHVLLATTKLQIPAIAMSGTSNDEEGPSHTLFDYSRNQTYGKYFNEGQHANTIHNYNYQSTGSSPLGILEPS